MILPVFLLIVVGLLSFGRVFFYWIEANHVASETARLATVDTNPYLVANPPQTLQVHARDNATAEFSNNAKVCIDYYDQELAGYATDQDGVDIGDPLRVRVQLPFNLVPFIGGGQITIRGSSTMRVERFATGDDPSAYRFDQNEGTCS